MRHHACLIVFLLAHFIVYGQTTPQHSSQVTGTITADGQPVIAATVTLLSVKDSSLVKAVLSDTAGHFVIRQSPEGRYLLRVTVLGYRKYYSPAFNITTATDLYQLPSIVLTSDSRQLSGVEIAAHKSLVEQKMDRTIVNVDASPAAASLNALELMERLPGVAVDRDGNISLKGKSGVLVLIDDKPTYLSPAELSNLLSSIQGTNLEQIEIMTNPPANYDAAGTAGVINIKTKKVRTQGLNGSVTLGGGVGRYARGNGSFNVNYHTGKVNLFASYGYTYTEVYRNLKIKRNFYDSTHVLSQKFDQDTYRFGRKSSHLFKAGADFELSKQSTFGIMLNGTENNNKWRSTNTSAFLRPSGITDSLILAPGNERDKFDNKGLNLNMRHNFDSTGRKLDVSLDYQYYKATDETTVNNTLFDNAGNKLQPDDLLTGRLPSTINIYSGKADYIHPLPDNTKLEAGIKSSYVKTDNDAHYEHLIDGKNSVDNNLSNHFVYKENINAAYVTVNKKINSAWEAKLGLRVENTNSEGNQLTTNQLFKRHYTQLFPTAYVGYQVNSKNQFSLSYGRRVERPDYQDMNPFLYFLDKYSYHAGNSFLRPQFSHNVGLTHTYNNILTSSFSYTKTTDIIAEVINQIDSTKIVYHTYDNLASSDILTASIGLNMPVTDWWSMNIYLEGRHVSYRAVLNNLPFEASGYAYSTNFSEQFKLWKIWTFELSGYYYSRQVTGTSIDHTRGVLNFAMSRPVLKKKGTLKFNVSDFANLYNYNADSRYQNLDLRLHYKNDSRIFSLSFTYRFSQGKTGKHYEHEGAAQDEQNRVKSN